MLQIRKLFWLVGLLPSAFLVGCANITLISAVGSSSVQPLLNKLTSHYVLNQEKLKSKNKESLVEISVQAGGSSAGIQAITNGNADIGDVSKNPKDDAKKHEKEWRDRKLKTITLGKDAIAVVAKTPPELKGKLLITKDNINTLYKAFAGNEIVTLNKFLRVGENITKEFPFTSFPRDGGALSSGTAEAFLKSSQLKPTKKLKDEDKKTQETLEGKLSYGSKANPTSETNVEAFNTFLTTLRGSSHYGMIYLSLGFVNNNHDLIEKEGLEIIPVQYDGKSVKPSSETASNNSYKWARPLNSIVSLIETNRNLSAIKGFFEWLLLSKSANEIKEIKKIYDDLGILQLTKEEKKKMFKTGEVELQNSDQFWVSDYDFDNPIFGAF